MIGGRFRRFQGMGTTFVHEDHRLRPLHIACLQPVHPKPGSPDELGDSAVQATAATDALPYRGSGDAAA